MAENSLAANDLKPHDLILLDDYRELIYEHAPPEWVERALEQCPFVVVRRSPVYGERIPVGIRGEQRNMRFAASMVVRGIVKRITPEQLTVERGWQTNEKTVSLPAFRALHPLAETLRFFLVPDSFWGPTGSVGFELATGSSSVHAGSDLDILMRAPNPIPISFARTLAARVGTLPAVVDMHLETPTGAIALQEYARACGSKMLLRTNEGPRMVYDPWQSSTLVPSEQCK